MMSWPPLKRHPVLQPFSREHMGGLVHARQLVRAADDESIQQEVIEEFLEAWEEEVTHHFDDEERLLLEMTPRVDERERLVSEHRVIQELVGEIKRLGDAKEVGAGRLRALGELLHDHIRWEEWVLFEGIQSAATEADLEGLAGAAAEIERTRPGSRARKRL